MPSVSFVSLGCAKNLVDSEVLLGRLAGDGWAVRAEPEGSDVVVINTCGFLQAGRAESHQVLREMVELRERGGTRGVVVAGCLPQRDPADAAEHMADADAILGVTSRERIVEVCRDILARNGTAPQRLDVHRDFPRYEVDRDRLRLTPRHYAYVRISEGCDHTCAFCIIPWIKGPFRSKPPEVVVDEARELVASGARELILIAQDSTSWGLDLTRKPRLEILLEQLAAIEGLDWIRLLYCYPTFVTDRLIDAIATTPKVVKYVDMPIQHTRERMLRAMRRGVTETSQKDLIAKMRERIPGVVMRTTVIVGFPGETDEDFNGMLEDLKALRFERLGAFEYSREPGTRADGLDAHLPAEVKRERWDRVMKQQRTIARSIHRSWIGREMDVIIDAPDGVGRTYGDAPDVDPVVRVRPAPAPGTILRARIVGSKGYDLVADA